MANIRKRGSKWQVQIRRQGHPAIAKSFALREDALKWSRQQERLIDTGDWARGKTSNCLLVDLLIRYEQEVTPLKRSKSDTFHLRQIARHPISKVTLRELSPEHVTAFRDDRLKAVSGSTVRKELSLLRQVLSQASREWNLHLKVDPVAGVRKPPALKGRNRRLEDGELQAFRSALDGCRNSLVHDVVFFALATGMRRGEILCLRWKNIDIDNKTAHVPMTKNGEARTVPLGPTAMQILQRRTTNQPDDLVFPISANALRLSWDRVRRRANITDFKFHDLRHEAISRYFEIGLSVPEVALISGHKDAKMLFRYTHLRPSELARKLHRIEGEVRKADLEGEETPKSAVTNGGESFSADELT